MADGGAPTPPLQYPKQVLLIFALVVFERFSFYGFRGLLTLYIRNYILKHDAHTKITYHLFQALVYTFPLVGAAISDGFLGKFRTILYFGLVNIAGLVLMSVSAVAPLGLQHLGTIAVALLLVAIGGGCIKPCMSALGGDQFVLPGQLRALDTFFFVYYFGVNVGACVTMLVTPVLRDHVRCFDDDCYLLGFGVPTLFLVLGLGVFLVGRPWYKTLAPSFNVLCRWCRCICHALGQKMKATEPQPHFLDRSLDKFGEEFVSDVKKTTALWGIFLTLPVFWALFDQTGGAWTLQANLMDGRLGSLTILPEQMVTTNALLILVLLPLIAYFFYPACERCNLLTKPLQRIGLGYVLAAGAFLCAAVVSFQIEQNLPAPPAPGECQIRVYNPLNCTAILDVPQVTGTKPLPYSIGGCEQVSPSSGPDFKTTPAKLLGYVITTKGLVRFEDDVQKALTGVPKLRLVASDPMANLTLTLTSPTKRFTISTNEFRAMKELWHGELAIERSQGTVRLLRGGVYVLLVQLDATALKEAVLQVVTRENTLHVLWQVPQYVVLTLAEIFVCPTSLEMSYTEAPPSMKSVMAAVALLMNALGNVIVVVIQAVYAFERTSYESVLYLGLMVVDFIAFVLLARRYKYVERRE